jgi:hypothetical protein
VSDTSIEGFRQNGMAGSLRRSELSSTRRNFIKATAITMAVAGVSTGFTKAVFAIGAAPGPMPEWVKAGDQSLRLVPTTFLPHLNSIFRIRLNTVSAVDLKLVEVAEDSAVLSANSRTSRTQSFSLEFTGPGFSTFPSGNYLIEHSKLGAFLLFVSPISRLNKLARYEAVFNHLTPS